MGMAMFTFRETIMPQHARLRTISVEEYLQGELQSDIRHEYVAGQVFAMVDGTLGHNRISLNIAAWLQRHLGKGPCQTYMSDVKVRIEAADAFYYPDVVVSCERTDPGVLYLSAPLLVVEVLSPLTENVDRQEKRFNYQKLASLEEYVLVAAEAVNVEVYRRGGEGFAEVEIYGPEDGAVALRSVKAHLPLADVYAGVLGPPEGEIPAFCAHHSPNCTGRPRKRAVSSGGRGRSSFRRRVAMRKRWAIRSANTPWPRIRWPKRGSLAWPPRLSRMRLRTWSAMSGKWARNQSSNRSATSSGSRTSR